MTAIPDHRAAVAADPRLGTILDDRFRLTACLGAGGMGVVYCAVQLSVRRKVALKVMSRRPSDLANQRFLREARLASRRRIPRSSPPTTAAGRVSDEL